MVVMEMPGIEGKDLNIELENDVLKVDGRIDFTKYKDMEPVYAEYNVGHCSRSLALSNAIDQEKIIANAEDGVLTLDPAQGEAPATSGDRDRLEICALWRNNGAGVHRQAESETQNSSACRKPWIARYAVAPGCAPRRFSVFIVATDNDPCLLQ